MPPLPAEFDQWEGESNAIVQVARQTASHVSRMSAYLQGRGQLRVRNNNNDLQKLEISIFKSSQNIN